MIVLYHPSDILMWVMTDSFLRVFLRIFRVAGRPGRRPLRPMEYRVHPHVPDFESNLVLPDPSLQTAVPDSDFYCFDNDRTEAHIKLDEVCVYLCLIIIFRIR